MSAPRCSSSSSRPACAELKIAVTRGELGETLIDAGARQPRQHRGRIADRRNLHGRPGNGDAHRQQRDAALALDACRCARPIRSSPASPANMPAGASPAVKARTRSSRSAPARRARWPARKSCLTSSPTKDNARLRHARPGEQRSAALRSGAAIVAHDCRLAPDRLTLHLRADPEPRRRRADRCARARGRAAQGARAQISARPHGRRHRRGAALAPASRFGHRHGPHQ